MNPATNYRSARSFELAMDVYERALANWPMPAIQQKVSTGLGDTFVLSFGDEAKPPLVLLHGSAANLSSWAGDAARFAEQFRVHAIDLPGETGKSTPIRPPYAGSAYPNWLGEVFDGIGVARANVVGLSLGGWVALRFASAQPDRVERLVLLAPGGVAPSRKRFMFMALLYSLAPGRRAEAMTRLVFSPETPPKGVGDGFAFMLKHYRARRDTLPVISDQELQAITAPTLLLCGARDALLDMPATAVRIRDALPHAAAEMDPDGGHVVIGKGARIVEFLAG